MTANQLQTVGDFISEARILLQDQRLPYRYADTDIGSALNVATQTFRRLRPDLFIPYLRTSLPPYDGAVHGTQVVIDDQYRPAMLWYICGHIQIRDAEETEDNRAAIFLNKGINELIKVEA